ncbi:MAG: gamma-glutamyltransferase [Rhizobiaceae bacterium]
MSRGVVTCARAEAAEAGAAIFRAGGNAADAAVAAAFALAVTDPANCGIGAYGGYAVVANGSGDVAQVDFNTAPPRRFEAKRLAAAPRKGPFVHGGMSVTIPTVVPGLWELSMRFGRLPWADLLLPATVLARDGFEAGPDLIRAVRWVRRFNTDPGFRSLFGALDHDGAVVRQPALAETLAVLAEDGADAMRTGPIPEAIARTVAVQGGSLASIDFADANAEVRPARSFTLAGATIHGPDEERSGFGVCKQASSILENLPCGWADSDAVRIDRLETALREAWSRRDAATRGIVAPAGTVQHTTHLCTSDSEGGTVSLTFTHGPLWFGSGMLDFETGVLLNCGANILVAPRTAQGPVFAQANICPIVITDRSQTCAFGSPGGRRIPGLTTTFIVDLLVRRLRVGSAIASPRVSVAIDGTLEVERPLDELVPSARVIERDEFYGPASAAVRLSDGTLSGISDPRFNGAVAVPDGEGPAPLNEEQASS